MMGPKYLLIVKPAAGMIILDTPRPISQGAIRRRAEAKGNQLYAYDIHVFQGVPYARLVPRDPTKPEWIRVAEAGSIINEWCDVIELEPTSEDTSIAAALNRIADALEKK